MGVKMKVLMITENLTFSSVKCYHRGQKLSPGGAGEGGEKREEIHYATLRQIATEI